MRQQRIRSSIALLVLCLSTIAVTSHSAGPPRIGQKAPAFTLYELKGKRVVLDEVVRSGRVTLLNFWATWCPPCRGEVPELISFYKAFASKGVRILAIDIQEEQRKVASFAASQGMSFPILLDRAGTVADLYGIRGIPTTVIIDGRGTIRDMIVGGTTQGVLRSKVQRLLSAK